MTLHTLSNLLGAGALSLLFAVLVGAAFADDPLARCTRCGRSFDSVPAHDGHLLDDGRCLP